MELSFSQCRFTSFFKNFTKFLPLLALDEGDIEILKTYVSIFIRIGFYTTCNGDFTWHGLMLFSVLLSSQARLSSVYPWFRFSFLSFFLLVWQFMVMNFKQTKIKFKPQIKLNHYIASVNSICTQHTPPPRGYGGAFDRLTVSPGVGHLQILHCQRPGHLPTPGAIPELLTRTRFNFLSDYNYTEGFTGKKADWLICQGKE